jgi:pimeloyl-ACP methyl ester carboxylesterase
MTPIRHLILLAYCEAIAVTAMAQQPTPTPEPLPPDVEVFTVRTASERNREVPFYVRKPSGFDPNAQGVAHRVLMVCPVMRYDSRGLYAAKGEHGTGFLLRLADERGWFIVVPGFDQDKKDVQDRKKSYYYPETFSGKATLEALDLIAKKYPIATDQLLLQGHSAGAQFAHRFALWAPERVAAVVINSSSWFDDPNPKSNSVGWLVTIGDSDPAFSESLEFADKLQQAGALPVFRSYIGMTHERKNPAMDKLTAAFLRHWDDRTKTDIGRKRSLAESLREAPKAAEAEAMPFVGDATDWKVYPNTAENRENIAEDARVYLPSEEVATVWGEKEEDAEETETR